MNSYAVIGIYYPHPRTVIAESMEEAMQKYRKEVAGFNAPTDITRVELLAKDVCI